MNKISVTRIEEKSEINLQRIVSTQFGQPEGQMRLLVRKATTHLEAGTLNEKENGRECLLVITKMTLEMDTLLEKP
jgi:hypothetical protein